MAGAYHVQLFMTAFQPDARQGMFYAALTRGAVRCLCRVQSEFGMVRFWCCPFFLLMRSCLGRITIMMTIARHHSRTLRQVLAMAAESAAASIGEDAGTGGGRRAAAPLWALAASFAIHIAYPETPYLDDGSGRVRMWFAGNKHAFLSTDALHSTSIILHCGHCVALRGLLEGLVVLAAFLLHALCVVLHRASWLWAVGSSCCKGNSALLRLHRHGLRLRLLLCLIWLGAASCLMVH